MDKAVNFIFITDLHFGIPDTERELVELRKTFIPYLKEHDIDILFFGGDYFDHKMTIADPMAIMAFEFFNEVVTICAEKNIKIRVIEGTQSHDRFQPRSLENFIIDKDGKQLVDYKFFETVSVEDIMGLRVLYIPEEYPVNINEYYAPYKNDKYDLIIIHGTWDFINFGAAIDNNRNDINTAPVFRVKEWKDSLEHGLAISGHIHGRHGFKDKSGYKVVYPGSYTAWSFDQISDRGFLYGTVSTDHTVTYELVNNPDSPKYANLDVKDLGIDLEASELDTIKNKIQEQADKVDYLKVNLDALPAEKKLILKEFYKDKAKFKTDVSQVKMLFENKETAKKYKKFDYLLKDNLSIEKAIVKYVKEELNEDITEAEVTEIITKDSK